MNLAIRIAQYIPCVLRDVARSSTAMTLTMYVVKPSLNLRLGWVITSHKQLGICLLIHVIILFHPYQKSDVDFNYLCKNIQLSKTIISKLDLLSNKFCTWLPLSRFLMYTPEKIILYPQWRQKFRNTYIFYLPLLLTNTNSNKLNWSAIYVMLF